MSNIKLILGDCLTELKKIPDESIDCCITSPPYWGLRDYGVLGQLGLEKTPEEYVAKMVEVFREVKRVLKKEGTLWVNLGDSYAGGGNNRGNNSPISDKQASNKGATGQCAEHQKNVKPQEIGLKPKDLVGIPWAVAFALRNDGWYLRQDIIWAKPNPMPESVTDRCTKSHEYIFLLAKSPKYYFDNIAIQEPLTENSDMAYRRQLRCGRKYGVKRPYQDNQPLSYASTKADENATHKNKRSVWTVTTKPFKGAHFATFPEDLVRPCILAGTSEKGVCPDCGKAWERIIEKENKRTEIEATTKKGLARAGGVGQYRPNSRETGGVAGLNTIRTLGWQPICSCGKDPIPATVLDPFGGAMTTCVVAKKLRRSYIAIELNPKYIEMAKKRIENTQESFI